MPREFTEKERLIINAIIKKLGVILNEGQMDLALPSDVPKLTSAGAGAGKTTVLGISVTLTELIDRIPGSLIHVMTFTNKATEEFASRHEKLMNKLNMSSYVNVSTIHAFCKKYVTLFRGELGFMNIEIMDDEQSMETIKMVYKNVLNLKDNNIDVNQLHRIEGCMTFLNNRLMFERKEIEKTAQFIDLKMEYNQFDMIRQIYKSTQRRNETFSFDEIMLLMYELLRDKPRVREAIQTKLGALFVDEFQDTSLLQMEIIQMAKSPTAKLVVVGDPNQSIYRWRGASKVYNRFKELYPNYEHAKLGINYRCPNYAVTTSNALIRNNPDSAEFVVKGTGKKGKVEIYGVTSNHEACKVIANLIVKEYMDSGRDNYTLFDKLVLYRNHNQAMFLIYELARNKVPMNTHGIKLPHEDKIAKDIIAICDMLENPRDSKKASDNLFKVITQFNKPKDKSKCPYYNSDEQTHFANVTVNLKNFEEYQAEMQVLVEVEKMIKKGEPANQIFKRLVPLYMKAYYKKFGIGPLMNKTEEDVNAIQLFLYEGLDPTYNLDMFNYECGQVKQFVRKSMKDGMGVTLLTIHSAKGLEAETVYLLDMNGSAQPNARMIEDLRKKGALEAIEEHIEEERSTAFVAITRTLRNLIVTYNVNNPSPFNLESGLNIKKTALPNQISLETLGLRKKNNNKVNGGQPNMNNTGNSNNTKQMTEHELQFLGLNKQAKEIGKSQDAEAELLALSRQFSLSGATKERNVKQTSNFEF